MAGFPILLTLICFVAQGAIAQSFRFAWLSDTHVGSPTGADDLRLSVRDINMQDDLAFVLLSGDITEMGWNSELRLAKRILDSLRIPYHIIPGNHDTKWSESGCTMFPRLWGADRFVFSYQEYLFIGLHEGPIMRMGDGHFAPEDLRWLDSVLVAMPDPTQPLFFVTHYPLDPSIDNWYEVLDRLKKLNTKAVLVGHGHSNRIEHFEGIPGIMGRSNLRARDSEGGYNLVEVRPDSMIFSERRPVSGVITRWHGISLISRNRDSAQGYHPRPDFSANSKYPGVRVRWTHETGYTIASAPAFSQGVVVAAGGNGEVLCLSIQDGSLKWKFPSGSAVYSTPDIADGRVVFGSTDGYIYCLRLRDGHFLWKHHTQAPVVAAPMVCDDLVYVGGSDGTFRAIELASGLLRWEYDSIGAFVETRPLVYQGEVIFGAWDTYLYALDAMSGSLVWKWSNGKPIVNLSPAACWPIVASGLIYIVAPDRFMTALNSQNGAPVWRSGDHQVREAIGVSEDHRRIYAKTMMDTLVCFSSGSGGPTQLWATPCGYGYDIDPSMPIEKQESVYLTTKNGMVYSIDGRTGTINWEQKVGVTIVNTPAPVDQNRVVITDFDGRISLIEGPRKSAPNN
jgi:outer membrane protein assembly factor BamB/predicted phosphodiesterase